MEQKSITMEQLEEMLAKQEELVIIDVRTPEEYGESHLEKAINIPIWEIGKIERLQWFLPYNKLIVYCARGVNSRLACMLLEEAGFTAVNLKDGISNYHGKYLQKC